MSILLSRLVSRIGLPTPKQPDLSGNLRPDGVASSPHHFISSIRFLCTHIIGPNRNELHAGATRHKTCRLQLLKDVHRIVNIAGTRKRHHCRHTRPNSARRAFVDA